MGPSFPPMYHPKLTFRFKVWTKVMDTDSLNPSYKLERFGVREVDILGLFPKGDGRNPNDAPNFSSIYIARNVSQL